jgi:hypothetical protein
MRDPGDRRSSSFESAPYAGATGPWKELSAMSKVICRPERKGKPGAKTVKVHTYTRSKPKPIGKKCGK